MSGFKDSCTWRRALVQAAREKLAYFVRLASTQHLAPDQELTLHVLLLHKLQVVMLGESPPPLKTPCPRKLGAYSIVFVEIVLGESWRRLICVAWVCEL